MSLVPSFFRGRRTNVFDPLSLDVWDPFQDFQFPSLVPRSELGGETASFASARIDWKETPEAHVFKADISGERSKEKEEKSDTWHRVERSSGMFSRRFRLPEDAKVDEVRASMENGVLTVTVPKAEVNKRDVKAIDITSSSSG
ncbi:Small heat shock protein HSP [Parasponia andersonii]|uniref:Small heat shock protein HSP n=1 Tax=Parasponia andersonii TaxID=3476 RepID=A0A2P5C663_PARAD|nr:Small heat shock protein HSP [Parasponia andersonii]